MRLLKVAEDRRLKYNPLSDLRISKDLLVGISSLQHALLQLKSVQYNPLKSHSHRYSEDMEKWDGRIWFPCYGNNLVANEVAQEPAYRCVATARAIRSVPLPASTLGSL